MRLASGVLPLLAASTLVAATCVLLLSSSVSECEAAGFSTKHPRVPLPKGAPVNMPRPAREEDKIQLHVVPHTHDDVGWLKTVDQYYLGANNSIQHAAVRHILDSVVEELSKDSRRKFIYVEQAFFQMWWEHQNDDAKNLVKKLLQNGQLEFVNGAWCMHDEAATHYIDMVDQTTLGHQYIKQQFGVDATPTIGWQIDPFGHSSTQASVLSGLVGFDALFFGRIDHQDHDQRMKEKNMEFLWRSSPNLGQNAQVFTGAFQSGNYGPPSGFCFDWFCNDAPMITDKSFIDYNLPERVESFLREINYQAQWTKGKTLMVTMGSDFQYENAREWFVNLDALIDAVNADGRINAFYSTPSAYVKAKKAEKLSWTVKTDDFFPYSDDDHSYWTGYFTSRPSLKRYVRTSSALLHTAQQLEVLGGGDGSATLPLFKANGIVQHHDAVSGTAKQHVAFDYAQRLHIGQAMAQDMMSKSLGSMVTQGHSGSDAPNFQFCEELNISVCRLTTVASPQSFQVLLYNPLARERNEWVSIPLDPTNSNPMQVLDSQGKPVLSQVSQVNNVTSHTKQSSTKRLNFIANVPGLGYRSYFIQQASKETGQTVKVETMSRHRRRHHRKHKHPRHHHRRHHRRHPHHRWNDDAFLNDAASESHLRPIDRKVDGDEVSISNEFMTLSFDAASGQATTLLNKENGIKTKLEVRWGFYGGFASDGQKSGAYIFRPNVQALNPIEGTPKLLKQEGPVVSEVVQLINDWINVTYRFVAGAKHLELEYTVGEVPVMEDGIGKEVAIVYTTDLDTNKTWYADSNGREMIQRIRDYRSSFNYNVTEPIAGNYVPMNAASYITDGKRQLTLLTDRSQGVVSQVDGTLEVMVHRRLLVDDSRGVGEPLNETLWMSPYPDPVRSGPGLVITGKHYLFLGNTSASASMWRPATSDIYFPLHPVFAPMQQGSVQDYINSHVTEASFLNGVDLPPNVDLVSFQSWFQWTGEKTSVLVRLAHAFEHGEDAHWSQPATVDLSKLFHASPKKIEEVSLTAARDAKWAQMKSMEQQEWMTEGENANQNLVDLPETRPVSVENAQVELGPMMIRTFVLTF